MIKKGGIIKFPNTKRKLSDEEEKLVHVCAEFRIWQQQSK